MAAWRPDLQSLRLFVAVCEEGTIARAAEREAIVPSAISKRLSELEAQTSVQLLIRGGRGMRPTAAGKSLLHHARHMLRTAEKIQAELGDYAKGIGGHVRLVANISSIVATLPGDLSAFLHAHPDVRVDVQERVSSAVTRAVRESQCDFGICLDSADTHGLELRPYEQDRLVVVFSPGHALMRHDAITFDDVLDHGLVGLSDDSSMTWLLSSAATRLGRSINYRMHVGAFDVAFRMVAENLVICVAPYDAVQRFERYLGLQWRILPETWAIRRTVLCMRDFQSLGGHARALVEHFEQHAQNRRTIS